jgi:ABC-type phosphate transport system auxiliary subunit
MKKKRRRPFRKLVEELETERARLLFPVDTLRIFFPPEMCSRQIHRWLKFQSRPSRLSASLIRKAIAEMKKIRNPRDPLTRNRDLYRLIAPELTVEEKVALLDLSGQEYELRLNELKKKYFPNSVQATE